MSSTLDRLVAERVMGWKISKEHSPYRWSVPLEQHRLYREWDGHRATDCAPFSTDPRDTFAVVDALRAEGWLLTLTDIGNGWMAELLSVRSESAGAELVREHKDRLTAILLAASAVKGVSDEEVRKVSKEGA